MLTLTELQQQALLSLPKDDARLEIDILLARAIGKNTTFLRTWPDYQLNDKQLAQFQHELSQLQHGIPLAYIVGERDFWRLSLLVNPSVLIPRPDTECVVEKVLALGQGQQWRVADLGTGSGAIALSLALEHPEWQIIATDISAESLAVAEVNALKNQLQQVEFRQGSWLEPLTGLFDCIVSNPPYIANDDSHLSDLQYEPIGALVAADNGLADLKDIVRLSSDFLHKNGWLVLEHGFQQGAAVQALLQQAGFVNIESGQDLGGNIRYSVGQKC
ncbi:MAG: peptide chain release factor N(5)-glutamine methyltransferase [Agitococcus sp.]|nr:peptide chain release factor N(5)-glutamine methyltransferase [Agitococcus sp.]